MVNASGTASDLNVIISGEISGFRRIIFEPNEIAPGIW
jgi:hypothetical protein